MYGRYPNTWWRISRAALTPRPDDTPRLALLRQFLPAGIIHEIAGATVGQSAATGAITALYSIAGTTVGQSIATGLVTVLRSIAGATTGTSSAAGSVTCQRAFTASTLGTSTATGVMAASRSLTGAVTSASAAVGSITCLRGFTASTLGTSQCAGSIAVAQSLAGTATAYGTTAGTLRLQLALGAATLGSSAAEGDLYVYRAGQMHELAGSTIGQGYTHAVLMLTRGLSGTAAAYSTAFAALIRDIVLAGETAGISSTSGWLTIDQELMRPSAARTWIVPTADMRRRAVTATGRTTTARGSREVSA